MNEQNNMEKQVTYTTRRWTFTISGLCPPEAGGLASTPPPPPTRTVSATDTTRVHLHPRSKYIITSHSLQCARNVIKRTIPLKIRGFLYNIEDISLLFFCNEVIRWLVIWRIVMVLVTIHRHMTFILPSHAMLYMRMYFCLFAMRNQMYNPYTQHSPWMHISLELLRHLVPSKTRSANRWMTSWPPAWQYKAQGLVESWYGIHFSERPRYSWSSKAEHCRARKSGSFPEHH